MKYLTTRRVTVDIGGKSVTIMPNEPLPEKIDEKLLKELIERGAIIELTESQIKAFKAGKEVKAEAPKSEATAKALAAVEAAKTAEQVALQKAVEAQEAADAANQRANDADAKLVTLQGEFDQFKTAANFRQETDGGIIIGLQTERDDALAEVARLTAELETAQKATAKVEPVKKGGKP